MSFILDALKKSEADRQRQTGPALYEVRVARPARMGLPMWAVAIVVLLGVNLVIIAYLLLHRAAPGPAVAAAAPPPAAPVPAPIPAPAYYYPQPAYAPAGAYPYPPPQGMPPQQGQPVQYAPPGQGYVPAPQPPAGAMSGSTDTEAPGANPDDYAPAEEAAAAPSRSGGTVRRGTVNGLGLYPDAEAARAAGLPPLHMDFHVFAVNPADRFVMINMHRMREGETSPEGVRVDAITSDGADISRDSAKYFLPRP